MQFIMTRRAMTRSLATLALIGTLVMYSGFFVWGDMAAWHAVTEAYSTVPAAVLWVVGMAMGIIAGAWGWQAGRRPNRRPSAMPKPVSEAAA